MFIVECLPLSKGLNKDSLSYFSAKNPEPGSLLKINLRGKKISGLVLASRNAAEFKSEIKSADFQLKKISDFESGPFLEKAFWEAAEESSKYFATSVGSVIYHLLPSFILENPNLLQTAFKALNKNKTEKETGLKNEVAILQTTEDERLSLYRSLIREEFARKKSVFLCLSQNEDVRLTKEKLERGIESFVCVFHNEMSKKDLIKEWKKTYQTKHPILVIATSKWLFLPREDLGTIIIDKENQAGWKSLSRPFIDLRFFARTLANKKNIRFVIGDNLLRTETLYEYKQGEIGEFESVKWRLPSEIETQIVDLRQSTKKEKEFKAVSVELLNLVKETTDRGSNVFILALRKGLATSIICRDCGEPVKCFNCEAPMVLYKIKDSGIFKCHQCGETRDAAEVCQNCKSWKLGAFGAGIERVVQEMKEGLPQLKIFELNKDIAPTNTKAAKIIDDFYSNRGSILLGTEMAFSYLYKKTSLSAIAAFDSIFAIPDFRIREKIFRLILQTKNLAKEKFLIQTRNPDDETLNLALNGNLVEFYKKEVEDRETLNYPPFGIFIKVTARGTKNFVTKEIDILRKGLAEFNPTIFPSVHEKRGEPVAGNAVIKLPKNQWPEPKLLAILKSLPPHFEIKIDPDNLL